MSHAPCLRDDLFDEPRETALDRGGAFDGELDAGRNQAEQHQTPGITVAKSGAEEQVRDADLMGREAVKNRRSDILSEQPDKRPGRLVGVDGVDQDYVARVLQVRQEREAESPAVGDPDAFGSLPITVEPGDGGRPQTVVAAEKVSQPQHQE
jgi:hypothetical protein